LSRRSGRSGIDRLAFVGNERFADAYQEGQMSKRAACVLLASLFLAACGPTQPAPKVTRMSMRNDQSDQLKAMAPLYRNLGLWRAIRDSNQRCKKVDNGAYQQDYKDMALWVAHCTDTGAWAIFIAANGEAQVRACANLAALELPACRPLPGPPSDSPVR
jgi:hypothetical protein